MRVKEIMTADPACCTPDTTLPEVARLMLNNDCGEIPIVDNLESRNLIGVVTDRDMVCRAVAANRNTMDTKVADVMSGDVVTISTESDIDECCDKMEEHQIRRIPVMDAKGKVCGIVAQADIARQADQRKTAEVVRDVSQPAGSSA